MVALSWIGKTCRTPTVSTIGGITIGRIVIDSRNRRMAGSRRCT